METTFPLAALMTPAEVSRLLQVPESTLAVWRSTGRVRLAYVKIGRAVRYRRAELEQLLRKGTEP